MSLSLDAFMAEVSRIVVSYEVERANARNETRKEELKTLPAELAAKKAKLAELQAIVEQEKKKLQDAEREGPNGIEDPFTVLKRWAEKYKAWVGWKGEIKDPESLPPLGWVRRVRNISLPYFSQYAQMYALVKKGKQEVFKIYLEDLTQKLEKAQEKADKAWQSYALDKERFERLQRQVTCFDQDLGKLREELTLRSQEDLEDILEDAWEEEDQREEILKLIPREDYTFEEEVQFTSVIRNHTIHLSDAVLNFETYA